MPSTLCIVVFSVSTTRARLATLFPYTTLFRSLGGRAEDADTQRTAVDVRDGGERQQGDGRNDHARETRVHVQEHLLQVDRKSTRLNSSHVKISYAVFCLKKKRCKGARKCNIDR